MTAREKIIGVLDAHGADCALFLDDVSRQYLTRFAFTDGAEQVLVFRDAAYTQPVSSLDPAEEDVSNGLTLYVSEE